MKPCSQVLAGGPQFHGYVLPLYALYGSVNGKLYICTRLFPRKDHYYDIRIWNGYRWEDSTTEKHPDIRRFMSQFMHSDAFTRSKCVAQNARKKREYAFRQEQRDITSVLPQEKKPQKYMFKTGTQSRIDGRGYDISWEENVSKNPFPVSGMPVEFSGSKPKAIQNGRLITSESFDGLLDGVTKDHLKVKQTKIRPEKRGATRKITITNRNGKITYVERAEDINAS